jgi:hypothetical protein
MRKGFLLWLVLLASIFATAQSKQRPRSQLPHDRHPVSSEELRTIGLDFVQALSNFYMSTHTDMDWDSPVKVMSTVMDDNRWLRNGVLVIQKYKTHRNKLIRLAAQGTIAGAELVQQSNDDLLALMRNPESKTLEEARYQIALYGSNQKEGYEFIFRSAPWITGMMFRPRTAKEDGAPVSYTISKEDREAIVKEIDRWFAHEIAAEARGERKDRHNTIVMAAQAIRGNLVGETYAEKLDAEAPAPPLLTR